MTNKTELLVKKDGWLADEHSSRNCYNCLTPTSGIFVTCRLGHPLTNADDSPLRFNSVIGYKRLFSACFNCPDFDNDWGEEDSMNSTIKGGLEEALRYLRETPHTPANRPKDMRQRMLAEIKEIEAEAAISNFEGPTDLSENLDTYIYGDGQGFELTLRKEFPHA